MAMQFCIKFDGNPVRSGLRRRSRVFDAEPLFLRLKRAAAVLVFGSSLAWSQSPPAQITAVRFWSFAEVTRIVIDTSAPCEFKTGQAQAPERLYLDITHARPLVNGQRSTTQPINDPRVRQIRIAETTPEVTRIVFDLAGPVDFRITTLDAPDRLVVELQLKSGNVAPGKTPSTALTGVNPQELGLPPGHPVPLGSAPLLSLSIDPSGDSIKPRPVFSYPPKPAPRQIDVPGPPPLALLSEGRSDLLQPGFLDREKPLFANVLPPAKLSLSSRTGAGDAVGRPSENASRSLTRALGLKINRVVIDAGHGGLDDGAVGPNGVREKNVVLDIALRLAGLVRAGLGAEVVLTRSDDTLIPLQERTVIANDQKADLFLSIHANSSPYPSVAGTETYFLNLTSSPSALELAARENAGSAKTVGELQDLLQSITLNDKIEESATLARDIESAVETLGRANSHAQDRGVKRAPFVVLIGASMPSVLAEIGFLSNSRDEANLNKPEYRQKIAEALYRGIANYRQSLSHF
jgi:N-acetylmuramoyl-L-alanine amidase